MNSPDGYEVFELLNQTENWTDWNAIELRFGQPVTLRRFADSIVQFETRRKEFSGIYEALARQNHGGLMRVFAVDPQGEWAVIEKLNPVEPNRKIAESHEIFLRMLRQLLTGLEHLHRQGLVHGRIQQDTVRVDDGGTAKLCDSPGFEVNREIPLYYAEGKHQAPELLDGDVFGRFGFPSDLYCLGMCLLEIAMGDSFSKLFRGVSRGRRSDPRAWAAWHASNESIGPIEKYLSHWPEPLLAILRKMIAKHVQDRYASASDVLDALDKASMTSSSTNPKERSEPATSEPKILATKVSLAPVFGAKLSETEAQRDLVSQFGEYWKHRVSSTTKICISGFFVLIVGMGMMSQDSEKKAEETPSVEPQQSSTEESNTPSTKSATRTTPPTEPGLPEQTVSIQYKASYPKGIEGSIEFKEEKDGMKNDDEKDWKELKQFEKLDGNKKYVVRAKDGSKAISESKTLDLDKDSEHMQIHFYSDPKKNDLVIINAPVNESKDLCITSYFYDGKHTTLRLKRFTGSGIASEEVDKLEDEGRFTLSTREDSNDLQEGLGLMRIEEFDPNTGVARISMSNKGIQIPVYFLLSSLLSNDATDKELDQGSGLPSLAQTTTSNEEEDEEWFSSDKVPDARDIALGP